MKLSKVQTEALADSINHKLEKIAKDRRQSFVDSLKLEKRAEQFIKRCTDRMISTDFKILNDMFNRYYEIKSLDDFKRMVVKNQLMFMTDSENSEYNKLAYTKNSTVIYQEIVLATIEATSVEDIYSKFGLTYSTLGLKI